MVSLVYGLSPKRPWRRGETGTNAGSRTCNRLLEMGIRCPIVDGFSEISKWFLKLLFFLCWTRRNMAGQKLEQDVETPPLSHVLTNHRCRAASCLDLMVHTPSLALCLETSGASLEASQARVLLSISFWSTFHPLRPPFTCAYEMEGWPCTRESKTEFDRRRANAGLVQPVLQIASMLTVSSFQRRFQKTEVVVDVGH